MTAKQALSLFGIVFTSAIAYANENDTKIDHFTPAEQIEMVNAHNSWRQKVDVPKLGWSKQLASTAQAYATTLSQNGCKMVHSGIGHGENIYWASAKIWTYPSGKKVHKPQATSSTDVTTLWGSEVNNYMLHSNTCRKGAMCGHYTQMVWKNTNKVGCGKAMCSDKAQIWVCHYNPPGNVIGQKPY